MRSLALSLPEKGSVDGSIKMISSLLLISCKLMESSFSRMPVTRFIVVTTAARASGVVPPWKTPYSPVVATAI